MLDTPVGKLEGAATRAGAASKVNQEALQLRDNRCGGAMAEGARRRDDAPHGIKDKHSGCRDRREWHESDAPRWGWHTLPT
eukprot:8130057-Alexandrium_andersonii.AAC.1